VPRRGIIPQEPPAAKSGTAVVRSLAPAVAGQVPCLIPAQRLSEAKSVDGNWRKQ